MAFPVTMLGLVEMRVTSLRGMRLLLPVFFARQWFEANLSVPSVTTVPSSRWVRLSPSRALGKPNEQWRAVCHH